MNRICINVLADRNKQTFLVLTAPIIFFERCRRILAAETDSAGKKPKPQTGKIFTLFSVKSLRIQNIRYTFAQINKY